MPNIPTEMTMWQDGMLAIENNINGNNVVKVTDSDSHIQVSTSWQQALYQMWLCVSDAPFGGKLINTN